MKNAGTKCDRSALLQNTTDFELCFFAWFRKYSSKPCVFHFARASFWCSAFSCFKIVLSFFSNLSRHCRCGKQVKFVQFISELLSTTPNFWKLNCLFQLIFVSSYYFISSVWSGKIFLLLKTISLTEFQVLDQEKEHPNMLRE